MVYIIKITVVDSGDNYFFVIVVNIQLMSYLRNPKITIGKIKI